MAEILADKFGIEAVEARGDGGMRRKDISRARNIQRQIKRLLMIFHVATRSFEHGKCRMTFIEMAYLWLQAQSSH